ncbi:DUF7322 domain-containing protein [Halorussus halophilus]|uniref:DUF7322 domain-containing protein n=1 Tax=Halorussus halophilus TaxID=2650975 RepID=UPI001CE3C152|nr:hypothetical protein [Halorussus halophilus]
MPTEDEDDEIPNDPTPEGIDEPEKDLLPDDPSEKFGVEIPQVRDTSKNDVDPELSKQFWSLVLIFNVALFAMSLGLMLIGFEGRWTFGGSIFLVGVVSFLRGWWGYKKATAE